jgi:MoaA/NifB/PqqE/SkfB family radical SAM enzyme
MRRAEELITAGVKKVMLSGGEPLLYKPIEQIIDYLVQAGALVKILTNGTIHRPRIFELVDRYEGIEVSISMESSRAEVNNRIFGQPWAHERILATIDRVPPHRLHINVVCSKLNRGEIPALIDWAAERRAGSISLIHIFQNPTMHGRFLTDCAIHRLNDAECAEVVDLVREKRREYGERLPIRTLNFTSGKVCEQCGAGRSVIYIDAEGSIFPCTLTNNSGFVTVTRGMSVQQALDYFYRTLKEPPISSCTEKLQALSSAPALEGAR